MSKDDGDQKKRQTTQYQNWVFTAYEVCEPYGGASNVRLLSTADVSDLRFHEDVIRARWQLEQCPNTQRVHVQGMCRMDKRMVFSSAKQRLEQTFGKTTHVEHMKGTWDESSAYCSKDKTRLFGPFAFGCGNLTTSAAWRRRVEYWYGAPGTGKSTAARTLCQERRYDVYTCSKASASKGCWLGGYSGEPACIMDEVAFNWFDKSNWKLVLDRMPQKLASGAGGKSVQWTPELIILISNSPPDKFLSDDAIKSRIHKIKKFNNPSFIDSVQMEFEGCSALEFSELTKKDQKLTKRVSMFDDLDS